MINDKDDNFDDIDLNELFNDFHENPQKLLTKTKISQDDLTELNENDCTAPRIYRKRTKPKKKTNTKQMTMYDYAASISYKNKQFYSSLDNAITTKTITKAGKRQLTEHKPSSSISKKSNVVIYKDLSPRPPPDFVDNLLQYLDERSRNMTDHQNN